MDRFLAEWREEAASKSQFDTAIFIGDKVLALTGNDADAIRLAQLHFSAGNYFRAHVLLVRYDLLSRNLECKYLGAHCQVKQARIDEALAILGDRTPQHLLQAAKHTRRKLAKVDTNARNGNLKHVRGSSKHDATIRQGEKDAEETRDLRFEAAMCYLRGICHARQNAFDRAKESYKDAVRIDVQCFEAFDQLMKNSLMSPDEEWEFLESLNFDSVTADSSSSSQQAGELVKMLYTTRLSKYKNPAELKAATETLSTHYKLSDNPDILLSEAELLFTQCRFKEALALTNLVLEDDRYNFNVLPVHLACLHELNEKNALFLLAHDLADHHPEEPATWLAVGVYYLTIGKIADSRRFFSKSSFMDPHFGPAWIGFAHTFAAEGEHDQAISAYTTAARLFPGTHLPQLFLGMQNLQLHNLSLAREFLGLAHSLCKDDPLLLNELGVVAFHEDRMDDAIATFTNALEIATSISADPRAWIATRTNLAHAYRRQGHFREALEQFEEVLRQGGRDAGTFCAKGLVLLELGDAWAAIIALHEALAINPQDPIANDLLAKALEESAGAWDRTEEKGEDVMDDFEEVLEQRKRQAVVDAMAGGRRAAKARVLTAQDDVGMADVD